MLYLLMLLMSVRLRALGRFVKSAQRELAHLLSVMEVSGRSNQQPLAADQQTYFFCSSFDSTRPRVLDSACWRRDAAKQLSAVLLERWT